MGNMHPLAVLLSGMVAGATLMACDTQQSAPPESATATDIVAPAPGPSDSAGADVANGGKASGFHARGNEPFWSVRVDGETLVYSTPDNQPGMEFAATRTDSATDVEFRGSDDGKEFVLIITPGQCEDSMSGEMSDYTATFGYGERQMTGCASSED